MVMVMVMVIVIIIIILGSRWIVGGAQNRLWQGSEGGMVLASQQERNSSTVKLDSSKWNLKFYFFIRMRWFELRILKNILWYILPSVMGRKSNGCLERELRSGIVFVSAFEGFVLYCNAEAFRGEITSLCLARNISFGKQSIKKNRFSVKVS